MFSPVGSHTSSVYWRRRLVVLASAVLLLVLVVLTIRAVTGGSDDGQAAGASPTTSSAGSTPPPSSSAQSSSSSKAGSSSAKKSRSTSSSPPRPTRCKSADLAVQAVVAKSSYDVGQQPVVELQATNTGSTSCIQDLADKQIELKVYNGESRVWGSHDCEIQDGTNDRTLAPNRPVRVSITWSGLTSQTGCKGTRQRVGAGTYTLYAALGGKTGKATQFSIG